MTNHRAGRTNTRDPRPWVSGKDEKANTARYHRRHELDEAEVVLPSDVFDELVELLDD